jgi:hypothetical protein
MASVGNVAITRKDMRRMEITVTAAKVRIPWHVLIPMKVGLALIRLGVFIAGVTYRQE